MNSRNVSTSSQAYAEVIEEYLKAADHAVWMQKRSSSFKNYSQRFSIFISASHVIHGNTNTNTSAFNSSCTEGTITKMTLFYSLTWRKRIIHEPVALWIVRFTPTHIRSQICLAWGGAMTFVTTFRGWCYTSTAVRLGSRWRPAYSFSKVSLHMWPV